jgi:TolB-like protein/thioredoxin-like negative regulator of GroEL
VPRFGNIATRILIMTVKRSIGGPFRVGRWSVEPNTGTLSGEGSTRRLQPRTMAVLQRLSDSAGELVSKQQLLDEVWEGAFVGEDVLSRCIADIRRAMNDDARKPTVIETVPRRGYRLIAPVERPASPLRTIAVLPLVNMTGDPSEDYLCDGLAELLTAELVQITTLRVISRTSASRFRDSSLGMTEIARQLGADALVEGSIGRSVDGFRVTVQLIEGATDSHMWARSWERALEDLLALQSEITRSIAIELNAVIAPKEERRLQRSRQVKPDAFRAYLRGRNLWSLRDPQSIGRARALFEDAIEADPKFSPARVGKADCHILLALYGEEEPTKAADAASLILSSAEALNPDSVEVHTSLAGLRLYFQWDFQAAQVELKRALSISSNYPITHLAHSDLLAVTGRPREAVAAMRKAVRLDPLDPGMQMNLAERLFSVGRHKDAIETYLEIISRYTGFSSGRVRLALCYATLGQSDEALAILDELPDRPLSAHSLANRVITLAKVERQSEAELLLADLEAMTNDRYVPAYQIARAKASLGAVNGALEALKRAVKARDCFVIFSAVDPILAPLGDRPEFHDILQRIGLSSEG